MHHCLSQSQQSKHWSLALLLQSCRRKPLQQLHQQQSNPKKQAFSSVSGEAFLAVIAALMKRKSKKKRKPAQAATVVAAARVKTAVFVRATVGRTTAIATATAMTAAVKKHAMVKAARAKLNQLISQYRAKAAQNSPVLLLNHRLAIKKLTPQPLHLRQLTKALKQVKAEN